MTGIRRARRGLGRAGLPGVGAPAGSGGRRPARRGRGRCRPRLRTRRRTGHPAAGRSGPHRRRQRSWRRRCGWRPPERSSRPVARVLEVGARSLCLHGDTPGASLSWQPGGARRPGRHGRAGSRRAGIGARRAARCLGRPAAVTCALGVPRACWRRKPQDGHHRGRPSHPSVTPGPGSPVSPSGGAARWPAVRRVGWDSNLHRCASGSSKPSSAATTEPPSEGLVLAPGPGGTPAAAPWLTTRPGRSASDGPPPPTPRRSGDHRYGAAP